MPTLYHTSIYPTTLYRVPECRHDGVKVYSDFQWTVREKEGKEPMSYLYRLLLPDY